MFQIAICFVRVIFNTVHLRTIACIIDRKYVGEGLVKKNSIIP